MYGACWNSTIVTDRRSDNGVVPNLANRSSSAFYFTLPISKIGRFSIIVVSFSRLKFHFFRDIYGYTIVGTYAGGSVASGKVPGVTMLWYGAGTCDAA